jgi:hypothetical protein
MDYRNQKEDYEKDYFVLFGRDFDTEKTRRYGKKMLYDSKKDFIILEEAKRFALLNMPASIAKRFPVYEKDKEQARNPNSPYIVVAKFVGKYNHTSIDGSRDPLTNFDALRCNDSGIEKIIELFAREGAKEIIIGLDLKLI